MIRVHTICDSAEMINLEGVGHRFTQKLIGYSMGVG